MTLDAAALPPASPDRVPASADAGLLEYLPTAALVAVGPQAEIIYSNSAWRQLLGDAPGRTLADLAASRLRRPDGQVYTPGCSPLERAQRTGHRLDDAEIDVVLPDGSLGLWSVSSRTLPETDLPSPVLLATIQKRPRRYSRRFVHCDEEARRLLSGPLSSLRTGIESVLRATSMRLRWRFAAVYLETDEVFAQAAAWNPGGHPIEGLFRLARRAHVRGESVWASIVGAAGRETVLVVPLRLGAQVLGAALWGTGHPRPEDADLLALSEDIAVTIARFVSRRQRLEDLARTESRLQALIDFSPVPIVAMSRERRVLVWNRAAEQTFGWSEDEAVGGPLPLGFEAEPEYLILREAVDAGLSFPKVLVRGRRKDGKLLDLSASVSPTFDADGEVDGVVAVYLDVTERTRFLQIAGHELRNPLATAKGLLSLVQSRLRTDGEASSIAGHLAKAEGEIDRTARLVQEILDGFRVAAGQMPFAMQAVALADPVADAAYEAAGAAINRLRVTLRNGGAPLLVRGDQQRLGQVVRNLVGNAFKYSQPEGRVGVRIWGDAAHVHVSVTDEGIGVPPEQTTEVFQPFARGRNLEGRDPGGLGLGLYVCRDIVTRHGGRIWIEARRPRGTRVRIQLPRHKGGNSR